MSGWWIAWTVTGSVILVVALVVLTIIGTARTIASLAMDGTRFLEQTKQRTEVLWRVATTNRLSKDLLQGAAVIRRGLGGDVREDSGAFKSDKTPHELIGGDTETGKRAAQENLPTGPQIDPEEGGA